MSSISDRFRIDSRARVILAAAGCAVLLPAAASAQGAVIRGAVLDQSGAQMGYSIISIAPDDRRILTDDVGRFVFAGLAPGRYQLRARHLGYVPLDTIVTVTADSAPQLELRLTHVMVKLAEMKVVARGVCRHPGPPDPDTEVSLAIVFGELRENAERAIALGMQFPFVFQMERRMLQQQVNGDTLPIGVDTTVIDGGARWNYRRGEVITAVDDHGKPSRQVNIPGLVQLADSAFHNAHCFTYGGVEEIADRSYIRVDFAPDMRIKTPDLAGSAYLDPESYQLVRLVMLLTHPERLNARISELKVTSSFREIVSSIAILDSAEGVTTFDVPRATPLVRTERQKTVNVVFTRTVPPGAALH